MVENWWCGLKNLFLNKNMSINYKIRYKKAKDWNFPLIFLETDTTPGMTELNMLGNIINDNNDHARFLAFVGHIIDGNKKDNKYITNGYTAQVVDRDGKKTLQISFHLTDDYPSCYVDPQEFKELLEMWINECIAFEQDPKLYKEKLKTSHGIIEED